MNVSAALRFRCCDASSAGRLAPSDHQHRDWGQTPSSWRLYTCPRPQYV